MALLGETGHGGSSCPDCKEELPLQVLRSAAGYYIGTFCNCGPYSRESGYYETRKQAEQALTSHNFGRV
jgi:hypothetical protein